MISDRKSFFEAMNLSGESASKYENIDFSEEDKAKLEEFQNNYKLDENFNFTILKSIYDSEFFLSENIMVTFIFYLVEKAEYSFLELFQKKISDDSYINNKFKRQILLSMKQAGTFQLTLEDILEYCHIIFEEVNDIAFYQNMSHVVEDDLFKALIDEFDIRPKREMNYLIIFILQNRDKLQKFVEQFQADDFEGTLFLIHACFEISKTNKEFSYRIVRDKLITKVDKQCNESDLFISNYLNLLFMLLLDNDDESIAEETSKVSEELGTTKIKEIVYLVYGEKKSITKKCAECLYSIITQASNKQIESLKYPIGHIYSLVEDSIFMKFCLPILSVIGIEESNPFFSRIENNSRMVLSNLLPIILELDEHFELAFRVVKILYKKKKITSNDFEENYFLRLLKIYHCYEIDADFICNIAIDLLLSSSKESVKQELFEYILSSIYDNYFYLLYEKVGYRINDEPKLKELNLELIKRQKLYEKSRVNPDFKPSEKNMNIYYEKEYERNRKINEEAKKLSVFNQLINRQTILYGNKVQYKQIDKDGNLHTHVSEMMKISHSMPIPVRYMNDPLFHKIEIASILEGKSHD